MIALPLIYFIILGAFFFYRNRHWDIDMAAILILIVISFCAIMIDINDIYGDYGINRKSYNIFTLLLFCFQWTVALLPLHVIAHKEIKPLEHIKVISLCIFCIVMLISSLILIQNSKEDIEMALIMDAAEVRDAHYAALGQGASKGSNYLLLLPQLLTNVPFSTISLVIWFYMYSFIKGKHILKFFIFLSSLVQAILSIIIAGRAAMVYWLFDFLLAFSLFHKCLPKVVKRAISIVSIGFGVIIISSMLAITFSRYDGKSGGRDPFDSLYGYAGQHINNFSIMFVEGWNTPFTIDREFPLLYKTLYNKQFDLNDHYNVIEGNAKVIPNVFDTFGGEVFLDLGIFAYVILLFIILGLAYILNTRWDKVYFYRVVLFGVYIAFFSHGLFAWPFIGHYTTMSLFVVILFAFFYKFRFRI